MLALCMSNLPLWGWSVLYYPCWSVGIGAALHGSGGQGLSVCLQLPQGGLAETYRQYTFSTQIPAEGELVARAEMSGKLIMS